MKDNENTESKKSRRPGRPFIAVGAAVLILLLLSLVPWSKLTGGAIKDFNLLADIFPDSTGTDAGAEILDPALLEAMAEEEARAAAETAAAADTVVQTVQPGVRPDTEPALPDRDSIPDRPVRIGDDVVMEDYTADGTGLARLRSALASSGSRPVRIAVIGDSYIEGDIFTQDVRSTLQDTYGGNGVGYMAAESIVKGFRNTVRHTTKGWTTKGIRDKGCKYYDLQGEYFTGGKGAQIVYKGKSNGHLQRWQLSRLLFIAPEADGTIALTTDSGTHTYEVSASDEVQQILLDETTASLQIDNDVPGLVVLGTWLEDATGVVVDNMSLRGYSGITHRNIDPALSAQMRRFVDYDLIVVEYGINALSASQSDYRNYSNMMSAVISRLKQCYPGADIVLMGIGDRGHKVNGSVQSIPTAQAMVDAQRRAARNGEVVFWDTREAMGGEGAVTLWRQEKLINPDYIHLNSDGGRRLARLFTDALLKPIY